MAKICIKLTLSDDQAMLESAAVSEQHKVTLTLTTPAGVREKKLNC